MGWGWGGWGIPTWVSAAGTGTILRADGTNWVATTATYPTTTTANQLLYSSAANVVGGLATAASGLLVTDGSSVPSIGTDIPTAVTIGGQYVYRVGGTDVAIADGGTGVGSWTNGQLLIGNTTGNTAALGTLTGTANQITVTNGASSITLSTPQNIATDSTPQFAKLGLGAAASSGVVMLKAQTSSATDQSMVISSNHFGGVTGTGYAGHFSKTGASTTNVGLYATASGGTNNYAAIFEAGNVGFWTTTGFGTSAVNTLSLGAGTAPTTSPADVTQLWTADWNGAGTNALFMLTEEGTKHVFGSNVGIGHITPDRLFHPEIADATTAAVSYVQRLSHVVSTASTGSSDGFGVGLEFELETGTDLTNQISGTIESLWATAANATRKGRLNLYAYDTAARLGLTVEASGTAAMLGFYGVTAVVRPTALTTQLTSITHTAPGTPDYALQNLVQNTGFGFVTADEGNTFLSVVLNLQTRISELETKLIALGLLQ